MIEKRYSGLKNVKMLVKIFCKSPNVSAVLGIERQRKLKKFAIRDFDPKASDRC